MNRKKMPRNQDYKPSQKILEKYADVLVNFALGTGKGIKKGEVVMINCNEYAKPLFIELRRAVWKAGGHIISRYYTADDERFNIQKDFYLYTENHQINFFPSKYMKGLIEECDHSIFIVSDTNKESLAGVDPKKIMASGAAMRPYMEWRREKENAGKFTWTIGLYGTPAEAHEAGLSHKEYWNQIIKACFLDKNDPIKEWQKVYRKLEITRKKLNNLKIEKLHILGPDADLWIKLGKRRRWMGGSGRNIPSFELFTSPDWRSTEGWIRFNQPLYRYGNLIKDVRLKFKNGFVIESSATKNEKILKQMIATKGGNKVGEFSLTDRRFSRITKFMAETLFEENIGGPNGNTHIALGSAYHDCYDGDPTKITKSDWAKLGFNDSSVHTDIISTTPRIVTAYLKDGSHKIIYKDGQFRV